MIVEWFSPRIPRAFEWFGQSGETVASMVSGGTIIVATVIGPPGPPGSASAISSDINNALMTGGDGGLFVQTVSTTTTPIDAGTFN